MVYFFGLIGFAIMWDVMLNDGDAISSIVRAVRGKK